MRYQGIETFSFTDANGRTADVHDMREIPSYTSKMTLSVNQDVELDEVASRSYVYGDGGEMSTYKLFEANMAAILDARFDLGRVRSLFIPQ